MLAHFGPNLQLPCGAVTHRQPVLATGSRREDLWAGNLAPGAPGRRIATGRRNGPAEDVTYLSKVFADGLRGGADVVAEGAGIACLAGTLPEELAGNMRGIWGRITGQGQVHHALSHGRGCRADPVAGRVASSHPWCRRSSGPAAGSDLLGGLLGPSNLLWAAAAPAEPMVLDWGGMLRLPDLTCRNSDMVPKSGSWGGGQTRWLCEVGVSRYSRCWTRVVTPRGGRRWRAEEEEQAGGAGGAGRAWTFPYRCSSRVGMRPPFHDPQDLAGPDRLDGQTKPVETGAAALRVCRGCAGPAVSSCVSWSVPGMSSSSPTSSSSLPVVRTGTVTYRVNCASRRHGQGKTERCQVSCVDGQPIG